MNKNSKQSLTMWWTNLFTSTREWREEARAQMCKPGFRLHLYEKVYLSKYVKCALFEIAYSNILIHCLTPNGRKGLGLSK